MQNSAFEFGEEIHLRKVRYFLHQGLWSKYDLDYTDLQLDWSEWNTIKYLNDHGTDFNENIDFVPNDAGGLYLFTIHCPVLPGITEFPVYIGRAKITENQNLRKRCKEYLTKFAREDERPQITRMIRYWGKELYLSYIELDDNDQIEDFEKKLINSLLLPFNEEIPDQEIRQGVKAFQL
jgi:hypothetical protein